MIKLEDYSPPEPRPNPVILLLDCSGSMHGSKIRTLNNAVRQMLEDFNKASIESEVDFKVAVITFSNRAKVAMPLLSANEALATWQDLEAYGLTSMGAAVELTYKLIESRELLPKRCLRPTVILVSDGAATDEDIVYDAIRKFVTEGKYSPKCDRWAMAIGDKWERDSLEMFIANTDHPEVLVVEDGDDFTGISEYFNQMTMTITQTATTVVQKGTDKAQAPATSDY